MYNNLLIIKGREMEKNLADRGENGISSQHKNKNK